MLRKLMMIVVVMVMVCFISNNSYAGWTDSWDFNIMGINPKHFKDRKPLPIIGGAIISFIVHEGGHLLVAELNGGASFDTDRFCVVMEKYHYHSHDTQQLFHGAGFYAQLITGGILTAIPATRHLDFTLGFNGFTTFNTAFYTITGGTNDDTSDIKQLDNGELIGGLTTIASGTLTYINLKKPVK